MQFKLLLKHYGSSITIVLITALLCGGVAGALFRFAFPQDYSSEIQILVIQKYTLTDSYTASKSAEKVTQNLAEVVKTSSFLEDVVASKKVDLSGLLAQNEADRREAWAHTLDTEAVSSASILKIIAYDPTPAHAEQIANAVADVLMEKGSEYHGAPDTISLKVVDTALTSTYPTRPNVLLNGAAAALFGALCAVVVLFLRSPKSAKETMQAFTPSKPLAPTVHHRPGTPVHGRPTPDQSVIETPPQYSVLHVTNFQQHLPAAQPNQNTVPGEVKTVHPNHS